MFKFKGFTSSGIRRDHMSLAGCHLGQSVTAFTFNHLAHRVLKHRVVPLTSGVEKKGGGGGGKHIFVPFIFLQVGNC